MSSILYNRSDCSYNLRNRRIVSRWLRLVAQNEGYAIDALCYIFCRSEEILQMNRQYLGHDYFTDVITFDYSDRKAGYVSGDVYIDVETVADNARQLGFAREREMQRVVVHGLLHLCGQRDKTPRTNRQMHRKEDFYLDLLDSLLLAARVTASPEAGSEPGTPGDASETGLRCEAAESFGATDRTPECSAENEAAEPFGATNKGPENRTENDAAGI